MAAVLRINADNSFHILGQGNAMLASDIMTPGVVSVEPEAALQDVVETMLKARISAVPVVDDGALVGIISEGDLIRRAEIDTGRQRTGLLALLSSSAARAAQYVHEHGRKAKDVMTKNVVTVGYSTPIAEIADLLETRHIKRAPVLLDGELVGIVSRANLIQALASIKPAALEQTQINDRKIREALSDTIEQHLGQSARSKINVTVQDGDVHLWGWVFSEQERRAVAVAAENTPGVQHVQDHMQDPRKIWA